MKTEIVYDVAIIGGGMIGSSAAKYVAQDVENSILIGPKFEQDGVYGAWHDEGRITKKLYESPIWRELAVKSVDRYRAIEKASGIDFYSEVGYVTIRNAKENYANVIAENQSQGIKCHPVKPSDFASILEWPPDCAAYFQPSEAGYISPRGLVKAQQKLAMENNCDIMNGLVVNLMRSRSNFVLQIRPNLEGVVADSDVVIVEAKKVIIAQGAYVNFHRQDNLLHEILEVKNKEPDLTLTTQTVAYLEVPASEAKRLTDIMPTIGTNYIRGQLDGTYILPPIKYPNDKYYLKLGHNDEFETIVNSDEAIVDWYKRGIGNPDAVKALADFITNHLIPSLEVITIQGGCCITATTPDKVAPYIEEVVPGLVLVAGGNGYAAKSCDEIGRIAAKLATKGQWTSDIPQSTMKVIWRPRGPTCKL